MRSQLDVDVSVMGTMRLEWSDPAMSRYGEW